MVILLSLSFFFSGIEPTTSTTGHDAPKHFLRSQEELTGAIVASLPVTSPSTGNDWSEITSDMQLGGRYYHASVVFSDLLWVIGGLSDTNVNMNDIWSSVDGNAWILVTSSGSWSGRHAHTSVVYKDKLWVIGGRSETFLNDVWSSWDGVSWTPVVSSAAWSARCGHTSLVFQDKMWIIGGYDGSSESDTSDIWSSSDGSEWALEAVAPWGRRYHHTSVVYNGKMWVIGGAVDGSRDVWSSMNGSYWTFVGAPNAVSRDGHTSVVYNGGMWIMGGEHSSEVWSSVDGATWTLVTASAQWKGRDYHSSVVFFNLMWVIGGVTRTNSKPADVWASLPSPEDDVLFALHYGDAFLIGMLLAYFIVGATYGYWMDLVRRQLPSVVPLSATYIQNPLLIAFAACNWIATLLTAGEMLEGARGDKLYGILILLGLIFPALITLSLAVSMLLSMFTRLDFLKLTPYLDGHVMTERGLFVWSLVVVSLMDPTLLAYLPWKMSDFAANSDGIPCMWVFGLLMYQEAAFAAYICVVILLAPAHMTFVSTTAFILNAVSLLATLTNIAFKLRVKKIRQYNSVAVTGHLFASEAVISLMHFRAKDEYEQLDEDIGVMSVEQLTPRERTASVDSEANRARLKELAALKQEIEELRVREEEEKRLAALRNPYADEDVAVLEQQLKAHNIQAARYIPLPVLKSELSVIMAQMQNGEPFDERRLEYLFRCLAFNKDYIAEQQEERRLWQESVSALTQEYLLQQRAFIPPDIFSISLDTFVARGVSVALAKRLLNKKCLWLLRMSTATISTLHEADLMGRYNPQGQNLDIVELLAVYAACPTKFEIDSTGKKEAWRSALEESVKAIMKQKDANSLPAAKLRNPVYKGQVGLFPGAEEYVPETVSKDHFGEKDPFLSQPPQRIHNDDILLAPREYKGAKDKDPYLSRPPRRVIHNASIQEPFKVADTVVNILHESQEDEKLL